MNVKEQAAHLRKLIKERPAPGDDVDADALIEERTIELCDAIVRLQDDS